MNTSGFKRKKVGSEKSVGEKFREIRKKLGYNLEVVEKETKISQKYLEQIENSLYDALPAEAYVLGFLRRYADFLKLNSSEIIAGYKTEKRLYKNLSINNHPLQKTAILRPNLDDRWTKTPKFIITPKLLVSSLVMLLVVSILSYIWYQVKGFAAAPPLEVSNQATEQVVQVESITVFGQTDPGANLLINNQAVPVDPAGLFNQEVKLTNGINNIEIVARNKANKETKKVIRLLAEY